MIIEGVQGLGNGEVLNQKYKMNIKWAELWQSEV